MTRWAKENLYEKKYIIFPLNKEQHWSTMVAYNTKLLKEQIVKVLEKRREKRKENEEKILKQ